MSVLEPARRDRKGDPNVAALLTWFLPGAGHVYLGSVALGVAVFAVVGGLYFLGLRLSAGMVFEYLDPELRSPFAPALSPEAGNLGGFLYQLRNQPYGPGYPRPWPEWIRLGSSLTALSGVLNVVAMVHAHLSARAGDVRATRPAVAVGLTWLVPGLGHLFQGRRLRALLVAGTLIGLFAFGTLLAEGSNLSRERHFYYWAGQFLCGAPALLAELAFGARRVTGPIAYAEAGLVFGCVAGLLNVLAMIDVFGWGEAKVLGLPQKTTAPAESAQPEGTGLAGPAPGAATEASP
jgi:TM2 domain-containing membrane protein YozV